MQKFYEYYFPDFRKCLRFAKIDYLSPRLSDFVRISVKLMPDNCRRSVSFPKKSGKKILLDFVINDNEKYNLYAYNEHSRYNELDGIEESNSGEIGDFSKNNESGSSSRQDGWQELRQNINAKTKYSNNVEKLNNLVEYTFKGMTGKLIKHI